MLGNLLATPNHTKSKENTKLNSFLQDLLKSPKCEFSDLPQNVRSKSRSGFEDYVTEVGSKIGQLDFKKSRFLGEKTKRRGEIFSFAEKKRGDLPL
jgi:hypothetical protein